MLTIDTILKNRYRIEALLEQAETAVTYKGLGHQTEYSRYHQGNDPSTRSQS